MDGACKGVEGRGGEMGGLLGFRHCSRENVRPPRMIKLGWTLDL
jgi:hypothetical protein